MKDVIPTVLYATEDELLARAVANEMEEKDPNDKEATTRILKHTKGDDGAGVSKNN